jgi:hypothetical protein
MKAIFNELNPDLGMMLILGETELGNVDEQQAHEKANGYVKVLREIRGTNVSYMFETNGCILAYLI